MKISKNLTRQVRLLFALLLLAISCNSPTPQSQPHPSTSPFLTVLGIAQDAGFPQAGCQKACCEIVWKHRHERRMVSCLGLVDPQSGQSWIFDATPDFKDQLYQLEQYHQSHLAGIFLTHAHIGHYTGLMHLGREAMGANSVPVYAMPRMENFLENNGPWSLLTDLKNIELNALKADSTFNLTESLQITPFLVPHRDEFSETVGFSIKGPDHSAIFIPDIDKWHLWDRDIKQLITSVDYAFLDGSFFANGEIPGRDMSEIPHPFIEESMALFSTLSDEERTKIHFIHFNHTNPLLQPESEARKEVLENGYHIAEEGRIIPL